ncbi:MAG: 2-amino-4-hydroxy-6-hydroxymethyldihydropteridine diphosphokinase [Deltaproteobacteria bacterium]|jgi:2-amino-4-hydroxy-6-hydroxymethyldihydropteridine diphosphokinase|nr:2-amino-4-hydroxy-6-hydroxymethyldihydropteridine diphosphokinase [Deltaproteobacteria bacterium]
MDQALAAVAFGANLENPEEQLRRAGQLLAQTPGLTFYKASSLRLTEPVGGPPGQNPYLNQVRLYRTCLEPRELLKVLLAIESQMGRVREIRWGPRIIDLDLLYWDQLVIEEPFLSLPHPRLAERAFVLEPLSEVSPDWRHPILDLTVTQLLARLPK